MWRPKTTTWRLLAAAPAAILVGAFVTAVAQRAHLDPIPPTPILTDRHGAFLAQIGHPVGRRVEYGYWDAGSPPPTRVAAAALALEDRRFATHPGVDPLAVLRAAAQDLAALHIRSGASTIAMQVARMQSPGRRTLWAKAVEAGTALALTVRYGRQAVLAQYLRLVPYGNGSHGIAHAARFYFDKPVADLSWAEIALLSAVPQAPALRNPLHPAGLARAKQRAKRILDELLAQGAMRPDEASAAAAALDAMPPPEPPRRPDEALHLVARIGSMLRDGGAPPLDPADRRIAASLDLAVQREVAALVARDLDAWRGAGARQAAALVIRRASREVVAAVGSDRFDDPDGGAIDHSRVLRSPGSTLKPFLYALALWRGALRPDELLDDRAEGAAGIRNADGRFLGKLFPREALANSRNTPAVGLLRRVGLDDAFGLFRDLGLHRLTGPADRFGLSMAIGSLPTSLDRLAAAYGALADDGVLRDLVWYRGQDTAPPRRGLPTEFAREVTQFLADPAARLPSFARYGSTEYPFPVALKTGTSQGARDVWTFAWSADWLVGVWLGRSDAAPMAGISGGAAAGLARDILVRMHAARAGDLEAGGFPVPAGWRPARLCVPVEGSGAACGREMTEYVPPTPPSRSPSPPSPAMPVAVRLAVLAPAQGTHFWRNPEVPDARNRLVLKAAAAPGVRQVVWYVDGEPFALAAPDDPVSWPMRPGAHAFQVRLPGAVAADGASRATRIVVD